jgi:uncharacterized tellurite resistance protein B-like protein
MLKAIQRFYDKNIRPAEGVTSQEATEHSLRLATAALLVEITRADMETKDEELKTVTAAVKKTFGLSSEETTELIRMAEEEVAESVSFHQFTHLINKGFSYEQKKHVVELLWRVVYADSEMEKHEEYLVRKIADLLYVSHRDFIEAKLRARDDLSSLK